MPVQPCSGENVCEGYATYDYPEIDAQPSGNITAQGGCDCSCPAASVVRSGRSHAQRRNPCSGQVVHDRSKARLMACRARCRRTVTLFTVTPRAAATCWRERRAGPAPLWRWMLGCHRSLLLTLASKTLHSAMAHDRSGHGRPWVYGTRPWPWHYRGFMGRDSTGIVSDLQH
jgi:hypothetical protein